jgi:E3 ubiquitin-protein ligase UBR4
MKVLNKFATFVQAIPANPVGDRVRDAICKTYIVRDAISHLLKRLQLDHGKLRWAPKWESNIDDIVELPALLKVLAGMVCCYGPVDELLFRSGVIPILFELKQVPSKGGIVGDLATCVIAAVSLDNSQCRVAVERLETENREENHQRAIEARRCDDGSTVDAEISRMLEAVDIDESTWHCSICLGSYRDEAMLLGIYVMVESIDGCSLTSSVLVPIHFHCHAHLKEWDPDQEWQQAFVINCEAPCNAIFPIPDGEHVKANTHRATLVNFYARFGNPAVASVVRDITTLFIGMADGLSVGNKFALLPLLVYAGHVLLEESPRQEEQWNAE